MKINDMMLLRFSTKLKTEIIPIFENDQCDEVQKHSKAIVALYLCSEAGMALNQAPMFVVDGGEDMGIDGIWHDNRTSILYFVQDKFRINQRKSFDQSDILKFKEGVEKFINKRTETANHKVKNAYRAVESALADINTKIRLTMLTTGKADLEPNCIRIIKDYCDHKNDINDVFQYKFMRFEEIYRLARMFSPGQATNIVAHVHGFSHIGSPYQSFFGYVSGVDVADWINRYGTAIFSQNVRYTLLRSEVNDEIFKTIKENPKNFWYFNNGITAIASEVRRPPASGDSVS